MFLLFSPLKPKFNGKMIPKYVNKVNKAHRKIKNLKNKVINSTNSKLLKDHLDTLKIGNSSVKVGINVLAALIRDESILNPSHHDELMKTTYSQNTNYQSANKETYLYTNITLGTNYSPQVAKYKNGPAYNTGTRTLLDTRKDCRDTKERAKLKMKHGANERYYCFLESDTCLTIDDIEVLSDYDETKKKIKPYFDSLKRGILEKNLSDKESKSTKGRKASKSAKKANLELLKLNDHKLVRHYAALLENETEITISSLLDELTSRVTIHMLQYTKTSIAKNTCNVSDLLKNCQYQIDPTTGELENESDMFIEKLNRDDIFEKSTNNLISRIVTPLDLRLTRLESFKEHCRVVGSWSQLMKPGTVWNFKLTKGYKNGIYLNRIHELKSQNIDMETPIGYFFMIESFGEKESSIVRNDDQEVFPAMYSPAHHHIEIKSSVNYICDAEEQDRMTVFKETFNSQDFEDEELALNYYPTRQKDLHVPFDDIQFTPGKRKKAYSMDLTSVNKQSDIRYVADAILESMGKVTRITGEEVNVDDIPYIQEDNGFDYDEGDEEANNPPYGESEHH